MTETTGSIYTSLARAQLELKAPKNETGRFGKSRSAEAILEAAKPVLATQGLTLVVSDEVEQVGDRHYVKATATVYNETGESIQATAHAWEGDVDRGLDTSQVTGKTSSYARKYALGGLLAIDDTKDADTKQPGDDERAKAIKAIKARSAQEAAQATAEWLAGQGSPTSPTKIQKAQIAASLRGKGIKSESMTAYVTAAYGLDLTTINTVDAADLIVRLQADTGGAE